MLSITVVIFREVVSGQLILKGRKRSILEATGELKDVIYGKI
jgi:hypothetical protein